MGVSSNKVFDNQTKKIDFRNLKATDLKNNKRVKIPNGRGRKSSVF